MEIYLEKISLRDRQEWWYNVFYDDGKYNKKIIRITCQKLGVIFRFIYIFMPPLKLL